MKTIQAIRIPSFIPKLFIYLSLFFFFSFRTSAQWTRMADASHRRGEMYMVSYGDKMYMFTGFGVWPNVQPNNEVYDPLNNIWKPIASLPDGVSTTHQGLVLVDDKVWFIGGRLIDSKGPLTSKVWIYDISQDTWSDGPELLDPVTGEPVLWGGGGAALIGRTIHLVGGFVGTTCNGDQDQYHLTLDVDAWIADPQQNNWENKLKPLPLKRNHISTTVYKGKMYVIGGQFGHDCGGGQDQPYSHRYDPLTNEWIQLTNLPTVRSHCEASIFPVDGKIYIAGGDGATNKITVLNPDNNNGLGSWSNMSYELPVNAATGSNNYIGVGAAVISDKLIVACGKIGGTNTRVETYTRPFSRNITLSFGFGASCMTKRIEPDKQLTVKNLLYTLEGERAYTLQSDAAWLMVTKNDAGVAPQSGVYVEASIDATGLAPGAYTGTITASDAGAEPAFSSASFCVQLLVSEDGEVASVERINVGGQLYNGTDGKVWNVDNYATGGVTSSKSFDVGNTQDDALYLYYRYASGSTSTTPGLPFSYNIPVTADGYYNVLLHVMEPVYTKANARKFHVDVEKQRALSDIDIYSAFGYRKAGVLTIKDVLVTDGTLNIDFTSLINNALIAGIEVLPVVPGSEVSFSLTVNTKGEGAVVKSPESSNYQEGTLVELQANPAEGYAFTGWSGDASGSANPLKILMDRNIALEAIFEPLSAPPTPVSAAVLLNAGGKAYTSQNNEVWAADAYFTDGITSTKKFNVSGTSDDALYLQYRFASGSNSSEPGAPFSYDIPLSEAGKYTVVLHMVEPVYKRVGARQFNVDIEGERVLSAYDIFAAHGRYAAVALSFEGVELVGNELNIDFTSVINNAIISAIEVRKELSSTATVLALNKKSGNDFSFTIYPNPNTGSVLMVQGDGFASNEALAVSVRDITGRKVYSGVLQTSLTGSFQEAMKLHTPLPAGVYIVEATGADSRQRRKLVVQ